MGPARAQLSGLSPVGELPLLFERAQPLVGSLDFHSVDLVGKHGRVRTVPVPAWTKVAIDAWTSAACLAEGHLFRPVNRADHPGGERLGEKVVWQMLRQYAETIGIPGIAPHDARRTCAKLCRAAGEELEQIQLLLGHASVQTTERYLGTRASSRCRGRQ